MAERTYISPLSGWRIVEDNGKTYISPLTGWAIQDEAAAGGALTRNYYDRLLAEVA